MKKIGDIGVGGQGVSTHNNGDGDSLKDILGAIRDELDALYAKLDGEAQLADTYAGDLEQFEK